VLRRDLALDERFRQRFRAEARHAGVLSHPNVVHVHDYGEDLDGDEVELAYLVMERVDGHSLAAELRRGPLDPDRAAAIAEQVGDALAAAHTRGIVHRDVKPANILLTEHGVKLADF